MPRIEGHRNISQKIAAAVIAVKKINPDYTPKQILEEIKQNKKAYHINNGDRLPGEGGIYKVLRDNKKEVDIGQVKTRYIRSELDKTWTVGSCLKHNIPPSMVPILIEIQKVMREPSDTAIPIELTIRQCRWIAFLYQTISANELLKMRWEPNELKNKVGIMATLYAKRE